MRHAAAPVWTGIGVARKGVMLDTPERIAQFRESIRLYAVATRAIPPNNITGMTVAEREALGRWAATP